MTGGAISRKHTSYCSQFVGASASQKVRAAEWRGEVPFVESHHPHGGAGGQCRSGAQHTTGGGPPGVPVAAGAVSAPVAAAAWGGFDVDYTKPWFELKGGTDWYCNLCSAWATYEHCVSSRHVNRAEHPQWYGFGDIADVQEEYRRPWFEERDGAYYCNLCGAWATDGHIQAEKHRKREACPEWYGFPGVATNVPSRCEAPSASNGTVAIEDPAWQKYWSTDDQRFYYHNKETKVVQWEPPPVLYAAQAALPPPMEITRPAAAEALEAAPVARAAEAAPALPPPWQVYHDADGKPYYHNPFTKVTQWEAPNLIQEC